jgi:lysozyme
MNQTNLTNLVNQLKRHEGFVPTPKPCPAGFMTIGYGHNCDAHQDLDKYQGRIVSETEAHNLLLRDISEVMTSLTKSYKLFPVLSEIQQCVLINMAFNLGIEGLLKFKKMLKHLSTGNIKETSREMLKSRWATQVEREAELVFMIMTEDWL